MSVLNFVFLTHQKNNGMRKIFSLAGCVFGFLILNGQNATDIFIADIKINETNAQLSNIKNISNHAGYDNQPHFISNTKLLFASIRDGKQSDIFEYDLPSDMLKPYITSEESEYSPTLSLDEKNIICVRVEKDDTQRLWSFDLKKKTPKLILPKVDSVGYFTFLSKDKIAIFALGEPQTLRIVDVKNQNEKVIYKDIGRTLKVYPISGQLYFVDKNVENKWILKILNGEEILNIIEMPFETEDFCITSEGLILAFSKNKLLGYYPGESRSWFVLAELNDFGDKKITRLAINANSSKIAFVVSE